MISAFDEARDAVRGASCWLITDGKPGDLNQCLGVAERLGLEPESRIIAPRVPFSWLMPWGPIDPREAPGKKDSPLNGPLPDIAIASGRRAAPYLRAIKQASKGKTLTVFLKDPRSGCKAADLIWVPEHDRLRGPNVITSLTSPHRISPEALEAACGEVWPFSGDLRPTIGVLIGGNSAHFKFETADCARLIDWLDTKSLPDVQLVATLSRRTPQVLADAVKDMIIRRNGYVWDGEGKNPYLAILAQSEQIIVTADSVNMVGEAVGTGKPVHVFRPTGGSRKIDQFLSSLEQLGAITPFEPGMTGYMSMDREPPGPIDATPEIAVAVATAYMSLKDRSS